MQVVKGACVTLHYTLSLTEGRIVDTTAGHEPLTITVGDSNLLPVFEDRLLGLVAGDQRRIEIQCMDAYGPIEEGNVHILPRADFNPDLQLESGQVIGFETPSGEEIPGTVLEVSDNDVMVDFTHPLAGYDLVFEIEILSVNPPDNK
jgi:FKBP-type peptidyl-prolyl cis-trans isomerase SlpA